MTSWTDRACALREPHPEDTGGAQQCRPDHRETILHGELGAASSLGDADDCANVRMRLGSVTNVGVVATTAAYYRRSAA